MHGVTYNREGICTSLLRHVIPMRAHPVTIAADGTITVNPKIVIERAEFDPSCMAVPSRAPDELADREA
jgi:hypothetical protein